VKRITIIIVSLLMFAVVGSIFAQEAKPYKEGKVLQVSFIKIKPGQFNNYMKYLDGPYKANMEAMKKAGLITGYAVYRSQAHTPQDADLILTIAFPNMAALDRTDEADAISTKVLGPMDSRDKASMDRESMRELLGSQLTRELVLK
jgi:competence protein ComGC